jgi:hypothetical protein
VIKFVSDFWQVGGFLRFPPPIKELLNRHDITEVLLKVALNTIAITLSPNHVTVFVNFRVFIILSGGGRVMVVIANVGC